MLQRDVLIPLGGLIEMLYQRQEGACRLWGLLLLPLCLGSQHMLQREALASRDNAMGGKGRCVFLEWEGGLGPSGPSGSSGLGLGVIGCIAGTDWHRGRCL